MSHNHDTRSKSSAGGMSQMAGERRTWSWAECISRNMIMVCTSHMTVMFLTYDFGAFRALIGYTCIYLFTYVNHWIWWKLLIIMTSRMITTCLRYEFTLFGYGRDVCMAHLLWHYMQPILFTTIRSAFEEYGLKISPCRQLKTTNIFKWNEWLVEKFSCLPKYIIVCNLCYFLSNFGERAIYFSLVSLFQFSHKFVLLFYNSFLWSPNNHTIVT